MSGLRLDKALVERQLCRSRPMAQELIELGLVQVNGQVVRKAACLVQEHEHIQVLPNELEKYVSRAGRKLEAALDYFGVEPKDLYCLDIGQSTGGFTDCLLQKGASHVVGVDVGSDQISQSLRKDSRVTVIENKNFKDLNLQDLPRAFAENGFDLVVADVSFISLTKLSTVLFQFGRKNTQYILLVKPQFEVGPAALGKGGIVRNSQARIDAVKNVQTVLEQQGFVLKDEFQSPIEGADGNQEYFIYFQI